MTFNNNFSLAGTGYKPTLTPASPNWTGSSYTPTPSPTQVHGSLNGGIGHGKVAYNGNIGVTHSTPNATFGASVGRSGVLPDNKGSNTYCASAKFNF